MHDGDQRDGDDPVKAAAFDRECGYQRGCYHDRLLRRGAGQLLQFAESAVAFHVCEEPDLRSDELHLLHLLRQGAPG